LKRKRRGTMSKIMIGMIILFAVSSNSFLNITYYPVNVEWVCKMSKIIKITQATFLNNEIMVFLL
jgi:hypothetical protein